MAAHVCSVCGREDKLYERGRCDRCALARRTAELMAGPNGTVPVALVGVHDSIVASETPRKALNWLRQGAGAPILAAMATGAMAVTHEELDAHPRAGAANYVRHMLVAHGALAARDERIASLERRNADTVAAIERPEDRKAVAAFATWRVLRRVRRHAERNTTSPTAITHARHQVVGAVRFLDWLADHHLTLATCTQGDLDLWLATGPPSRYNARFFVKWSSQRHLSATLEVPARQCGPGDALDAEQRWAIITRLLHDPDVELCDRVAGSFVLLYAQPLSRVAVMTLDQITDTATGVIVRFGTQDLAVPDPLGSLIIDQSLVGRSHHIGIGATPTTWLFPGHLPGRPISAHHLGVRLKAFSIDARAARRAAQQQLASQVPAIVLAEMLGVSIGTAVNWVHTAGGDWANYAAMTAARPNTDKP